MGCPSSKILRTILKIDEGRNQTNKPGDKKRLMMMHKALHLRDDIEYTCEEKKVEEKLPALKIASKLQSDSKTT